MPTTPERKKKCVTIRYFHAKYINHINKKKIVIINLCWFALPIVRALAKMTPDRMNTMIDALPRNATNLLTKNCPQKPAKIETDVRYNAARNTRK